VDADRPLKRLYKPRRRDLLSVTGDDDTLIVARSVPELTATRRAVDTVLHLRRPDGQEYLRHIEFEGRYRRGVELRLFEYSSRLAVQHRLPVATTVMFVHPPAPKEPRPGGSSKGSRQGERQRANAAHVCGRRGLDASRRVRHAPGALPTTA